MASPRPWLALAGLTGLWGGAGGALGALGGADPQVKGWLQTGAQYQLVHGAAALACFALLQVMARQAGIAAWLFGAGALVFGGSLYLLALTGVRLWGAVTPVGGLLMIAGWAVLLWGAFAAD